MSMGDRDNLSFLAFINGMPMRIPFLFIQNILLREVIKMKNGTTSVLPVRFRLNGADIESITFLFKQEKSNLAPEILVKNYPGDVEYKEDSNVFEVPFTEAETWLFTEDEPFYMDTKLTLISGHVPETPIVTLRMHPTLFSRPEEDNEEASQTS
jgi:hypothetical protein